MTVCLPDPFIFIALDNVMSGAVGTRGNLRRNEGKCKKKAEKLRKSNILENAGTVFHKVFCL